VQPCTKGRLGAEFVHHPHEDKYGLVWPTSNMGSSLLVLEPLGYDYYVIEKNEADLR
jgi:hypothetical protein